MFRKEISLRAELRKGGIHTAVITLLAIIFVTAAFSFVCHDTYAVSSKDAKSSGMTVSVEKSKVKIKIKRVGKKGTAKLYMCRANQYNKKDKLNGISKSAKVKGTYIGKYKMGSNKTFTVKRYKKGVDLLYNKYYLVDKKGKIVKGPIYASKIYSPVKSVTIKMASKKGLFMDDAAALSDAKDLGASSMAININLAGILYPKYHSNAIRFKSNGKTYYFNKSKIEQYDNLISANTQNGLNTTATILLMDNGESNGIPSALLYSNRTGESFGMNTSNSSGRDYFIACMEFLASRYSRGQEHGMINNYVIGNEVDFTGCFMPEKKAKGKKQTARFNEYMEEYARALRLSNAAVKKYAGDAKVHISITHNWAAPGNEAVGGTAYAPKAMLEWLAKYSNRRGGYDWGITPHIYGFNLPASDVGYNDTGMNPMYPNVKVGGNYNSSKWLTISNFEILQKYLEQNKMRCGTKVRDVILQETGVSSEKNTKADKYRQAAYIAQLYYKAAHMNCVSSLMYFRLHDTKELEKANANFGLIGMDGKKKPAYTLWKYIDTDKSFDYSNRYLGYIQFQKGGKVYKKANGNISTWKDAMKVVDSTFNWDTQWSTGKIEKRKTGKVERSLSVSADSYDANDSIRVTAAGASSDIVGLYKAGDDPESKAPIFWYYVGNTNNGISHTSGKTYDVRAAGQISDSRYDEATLTAGKYKIALLSDGTDVVSSRDITITGSIDTAKESVKTNKTSYHVGENIIATATGEGAYWVGIYNEDDTYGTGSGTTTSIYWYYVNDKDSGKKAGVPVILQNTNYNRTDRVPTHEIPAGKYKVILFRGSGYDEVASTKISVGESAPDTLKSIHYSQDNTSDGYANGTVTITKDAANETATDCVMYWAGADGNPLAGYDALAKFRLTGDTTTFHMYEHTIIPEGAKKLIAYAANGKKLSSKAVSVDLPEGSSYQLGSPIMEFQIVSDVHITNDSSLQYYDKYNNEHFTEMLNDVKKNSPNSRAIVINGDMANNGRKDQFYKMKSLYDSAGVTPKLHIAIGNHDWMAGNPNNQFQDFVHLFNPSVSTPKNVYYDEWVNGYHFIYLGGEKEGLHAQMSDAQLKWFDKKMKEDTEKDPNRPVFVFLHQSMKNTVAGSFNGQGWDGVDNTESFQQILKKYGQIILYNGHSHWELNSTGCMFSGSTNAPVAFNTASVGYLWTSYNETAGEYTEGSNGYYIRVYNDKIAVLGRDFVNGKWIPSAMFIVEKDPITVSKSSVSLKKTSKAYSLNAKSASNAALSYVSSDTSVATVSSSGKVTPKKAGTAVITITSDGSGTKTMNRKDVKVTVK